MTSALHVHWRESLTVETVHLNPKELFYTILLAVFSASTYVEGERQTLELVQIQQLQTELREGKEQTSSASTYSRRH